ncbi:ribosome biogenesis GTPase Der [Candidatus Uhrbacteria bacterium]|jgi:GTPase|nr:ribosome biogenesis GTPase Der [Candidatus Uhrbacteria bacterium]
MKKNLIPTIALVGRTNVGKSSLFNRLLERPKAIVSSIAGTTRDRNEGECLWRGKIIRIIDTGGLDGDFEDQIDEDIVKQSEIAMKQADLVLFVVDLHDGAMPQERELAKKFVKLKAPVILVGNKADKHADRLSINAPEWQFPGLNVPIPVSAARGAGVGDLLDVIFDKLKSTGHEPVDPKQTLGTRVAVIGKPNVGKSTLLNSVLGEERFITSPIAHTTREPNDTLVKLGDKQYIFIDTAGMRKSGKVKKAGGLEAAAVRRNQRVIKHADVSLLVVDANSPIGTQEKTLAGVLKDSGSGVIVVVNKWDLVEDKTTNTMNEYRDYMAQSFPFLRWVPFIYVSALTKQRVKNLFPIIDMVQEKRSIIIDQETLDDFLERAMRHHAPKRGKGVKPPKVLGLKQTKSQPPTFQLIIKAKRRDVLSVAYVRYIENQLREKFELTGTPIKMNVQIARSVAN